MPASLFDSHAPDGEMLIVAWLSSLRRSGVAYSTGDTLPFTLVTRSAGEENFWIRSDDPVISVHTLCNRDLGYAAAAAEAQKTHDRMLELAWTLGPVTMPDSSQVAVDYVTIFQPQQWLDFEDVKTLRKVGRYKIGLPYIGSGVS